MLVTPSILPPTRNFRYASMHSVSVCLANTLEVTRNANSSSALEILSVTES